MFQKILLTCCRFKIFGNFEKLKDNSYFNTTGTLNINLPLTHVYFKVSLVSTVGVLILACIQSSQRGQPSNELLSIKLLITYGAVVYN
jgi:hypothetical protein